MEAGVCNGVGYMIGWTCLLCQVEDIVDTGSTLSCLIAHLETKGASSVSVCTFLDKPTRRKVHFQPLGQGKFYKGFEVTSLPYYFPVCVSARTLLSTSWFCFRNSLT